MVNVIFLKLLTLSFIVYAECHSSVSSNLMIVTVDRLVSISSQIVDVTYKITLQNAGTEAASNFIFTVDPKFIEHVAIIKSWIPDFETVLTVSETIVDEKKAWSVQFENALEAGQIIVINVYYSLIDCLIPYPTKIAQQNEKQYIKFIGNSYIYTPYPVSKVTTCIALATKLVENYALTKPTSYSDSHIWYGPYKDLPPYSVRELEIQYRNNSSFLTVSKLERTIQVSYQGNITVEEKITLKRSGLSSVESLKTILPANATDIYIHSDKIQIGSILTSYLHGLKNSVQVELQPKCTHDDGWNTEYILGYSIPSHTYLRVKGNNHSLKMPLIDHIFDNMVIKEAIIKIILPEASLKVDLNLPYSVQRLPDSLNYTPSYTKIGRPVVIVRKTNLIEDHIAPFELHYVDNKLEHEYLTNLKEDIYTLLCIALAFFMVYVFVFHYDSSLCNELAQRDFLIYTEVCPYMQSVVELFRKLDDQFHLLDCNNNLDFLNKTVQILKLHYAHLSLQFSKIVEECEDVSPELVSIIIAMRNVHQEMNIIFFKEMDNIDFQGKSFHFENQIFRRKSTKLNFTKIKTEFCSNIQKRLNKLKKLCYKVEDRAL